MSPRALTFALGAAIILAANAVALGGVAWNRSGEPASRVALSQRELARPPEWRASREDSSLALSLKWRVPRAGLEPYEETYWRFGGSPAWLDERRLAELGFDVERAKVAGAHSQRALRKSEREVRVVLELAGAAWRQALDQARSHLAEQQALLAASPDAEQRIRAEKLARERLAREEHENSRLFAVDVGTDVAALRAQYPDRSRYLILAARLRLQRTTVANAPAVSGYLNTLAGHRINVPHALRGMFEVGAVRAGEAADGVEAHAPFAAVVAVGRRLEPWIEEVSLPAASSSPGGL